MSSLLGVFWLLTCALIASCSVTNELTTVEMPVSSGNTDITRLWGAYSPFFEAGTYEAPPAGCTINQVHLLQRHGARYPTSGASTSIISGINKLQSVQHYTDPRLDFLKTFTYSLGVADLISFGAHQSAQTGALSFTRYSHLINATNLPFVRASSSTRVVDSATNWTTGFSAANHHLFNPSLSVILSENGNDTLDDNMCPNAGTSDAETNTWLAVFAPPITARLNRWAPTANLTDAETFSLLSMCPFHTLASASTAFVSGTPPQLQLSPFCALFSVEEFAAFEYSMDLDKFYGTGYGAPLGPVQGVGYINELLARLTNAPVNDSTQTNSTLTGDPKTFPLDRTMYADFSHDNEMIAIYAAMGLFPQRVPLDPRGPAATAPGREREGKWVASRLVPFSARMVVERMECGEWNTRDEGKRKRRENYVRVLVNDALQPLEFCGAPQGGGMKGICTLEKFVESQGYARGGGGGDWEKCFSA
ncbi:acid phosphatase [Favolaschia claudopus]|uniref:Phytase A n=1 Tax=Favolaschia claudopus TaxID=2862362 RepID=A0AAW0CYV9_9AGAR